MARKKKSSRSASPPRKKSAPVRRGPGGDKHALFQDQVNLDQQKYSRYVCDSRAIPHEIDGLKPVQRRILWAMWNSSSRNNYTKTVKMAGLAMAYHPHGDKSIQDALSTMAQDFPFANNYPLIAGEGTFGDILDPQAIASPRYTEVRISEFARDVGFFESLPDIDYVTNYDETDQEPTFFFGKIPVVLLNNVMGIATGFRCNMPGHRLSDVVDSMIHYLKKKKPLPLDPWYKNYRGHITMGQNNNGDPTLTTHFGFDISDGGKAVTLVAAPQNWNRSKVVDYLEDIIGDKESPLRDYNDYSTSQYQIELEFKRGFKATEQTLAEIFSRTNSETLAHNVITVEGTLQNHPPESIIRRFCDYRKKHLIRRFTRLAELEQEKIARNSELIRFIKEEWNLRVTKIKSKADFENQLKKSKFVYFEWLAGIPVYRMTIDEVRKCEQAIVEAKEQYRWFRKLVREDKALTGFMIEEISELKEKWDK